MTETEWLGCTDPASMLKSVRHRSSNRKLRLFACACCFRFRHLIVTEAQQALEVAERYAEGLATPDERKKTRELAFHAAWVGDPGTAHRRGPAKACVCDALARSAYDAAVGALFRSQGIGLLSKTDWPSSAIDLEEGLGRIVDWSSGEQEQAVFHAELLRDVFGNPFRPVSVRPAWLTPSVLAVARSIYDARAFDRLPDLADALVIAGCDEEVILMHCRSEGPHVRGCWGVDLVLGKE
jgi:hypothetical protein